MAGQDVPFLIQCRKKWINCELIIDKENPKQKQSLEKELAK